MSFGAATAMVPSFYDGIGVYEMMLLGAPLLKGLGSYELTQQGPPAAIIGSHKAGDAPTAKSLKAEKTITWQDSSDTEAGARPDNVAGGDGSTAKEVGMEGGGEDDAMGEGEVVSHVAAEEGGEDITKLLPFHVILCP
ncbi:hypothetical protein JD844_026914 [Phrynosoma platyrhinos]|uniref:Uncharacterized protein n=1 Tax=Phrynosoma platyrhinos TaxID=52577 RepID=A0ABQ7SFH9_PHRPL|nr:hypothetical protein JD844_026914 [Phrynosoma platyrhinos]